MLVDSDVEAEVDQLDSDTEGLDELGANGAPASANNTLSSARSSRPGGTDHFARCQVGKYYIGGRCAYLFLQLDLLAK